MRRPRFGKLTDGLFYIFAMLSGGAIGIFAFENNPFLKLFAGFAWVLVCVFYVFPWFYPEPKIPVFSKKDKSVAIDLSSPTFFMSNNGKVIIITVVPAHGTNPVALSVFDNHINGWGKACNGINETYVQTMAGDLSVHKTSTGFCLSWNEEENWKMGL